MRFQWEVLYLATEAEAAKAEPQTVWAELSWAVFYFSRSRKILEPSRSSRETFYLKFLNCSYLSSNSCCANGHSAALVYLQLRGPYDAVAPPKSKPVGNFSSRQNLRRHSRIGVECGGNVPPTFWSGGTVPPLSDTHDNFWWKVVNLMSSPETETRLIRQLVVKAD